MKDLRFGPDKRISVPGEAPQDSTHQTHIVGSLYLVLS
jgi:hypothetical protein